MFLSVVLLRYALGGGKRRKAEFTGRKKFRLEIMTGGTNGVEHGGLGLRIVSYARGNGQIQIAEVSLK